MNKGSVSNRFAEMTIAIERSEKRILKLEKANRILSEQLEDQHKMLIEFQKNNISKEDEMSLKVNQQNKTLGEFEILLNKKIEDLQQEITEEINKKIERISSLIRNSYYYEKTKSCLSNTDDDLMSRGNQSVAASPKPENLPSLNSLKLKQKNRQSPSEQLFDSPRAETPDSFRRSHEGNTQLQNFVSNEIRQLRNEMNGNFLKLEYLEGRVREVNSGLRKDINLVQGEVGSLREAVFKDQSIDIKFGDKINDLQNYIVQTNQNISNLTDKLNNFIKTNKAVNDNYDNVLYSHNSNFTVLNDNLKKELKNVGETFAIKVNNNEKSMNDKFEAMNKELSHFEKHILEEQDNFVKYVKSCFDLQNNNMKKISMLTNNDIDMLKEQNMDNDSKILKLKDEFNRNLNNTEEYFKNKYDTIFRMVNK
ncbi:MAG: hypothetical protein MJ252_01250 [archaeon]|nr:hypothetical protein [archaeon]